MPAARSTETVIGPGVANVGMGSPQVVWSWPRVRGAGMRFGLSRQRTQPVSRPEVLGARVAARDGGTGCSAAATARTSHVLTDTPSRAAAASTWPFSWSGRRSVVRDVLTSSGSSDRGPPGLCRRRLCVIERRGPGGRDDELRVAPVQADIDGSRCELGRDLARRRRQRLEQHEPDRGVERRRQPVGELTSLVPTGGGCGSELVLQLVDVAREVHDATMTPPRRQCKPVWRHGGAAGVSSPDWDRRPDASRGVATPDSSAARCGSVAQSCRACAAPEVSDVAHPYGARPPSPVGGQACDSAAPRGFRRSRRRHRARRPSALRWSRRP